MWLLVLATTLLFSACGGGVSASATLNSISVTPTNPGIALGTKQQFTATGIYSDNTTKDLTAVVTWSSSTPGVATISNAAGSDGLATSVAAGSTIITATSGSVNGTTILTVTNATLLSVAITPAMPSIALGTTRQFTATGIYTNNTTQNLTTTVIWSSSSPDVATVSNAAGSNGLATSVVPGSSTITVTLGNISGSTTLTVTNATLVSIAVDPTKPSIALGTMQPFTATGTYSDDTTQDLTAAVIWSSSTPSVATISNAAGSDGLATSVAAGSTIITATSGSVSGTTKLTVTNATLLSVAITPTMPSIALGTTRQFTATGTYSDNTRQDLTALVTWSSSIPAIAIVSNAATSHGLAVSTNVGSSTIKAAVTGIFGTTILEVTNATLVSIKVNPPISNIALETKQQFTATGTYSDNTTQDFTSTVIWSLSSPGVATISNAAGSNGIAVPVTVGISMITATSGSLSAAATLTVTDATLISIAVDPINPSIILGTKQQFTATGTFSDNTTQDLTTIVSWSSSTPDIATISNAAKLHGSATSVAVGSSMITATLGGVSGTATLTVVFNGTLTLTPRNDIAGAGQEAWSFTYTEPGWDTTVAGFILKPVGSGPFPGVVISHGKGGNAETYISDKGVNWFAPNGYITIAVDLTHTLGVQCNDPGSQCGGSPENVRRDNRAFQILRSQDLIDQIGEGDVVSRNCTLLYGNSLGALTTLELAEELGSNVCAVALSAGGIFTNEIFTYMTPSGANGVNQIFAPVIHMHGRVDDVVPTTAEDTMSNALNTYDKIHQQVWFPGGHDIASAPLTTDQVRDFVFGWFSAYLNHTEPNITSLSATSGSVGDTVVIFGSNFSTNVNGNSVVNIGGLSAGIVSWSDTNITATVPIGAASGSLEVIVPIGPITDPGVEQPVKGGVRSNRMDFTVL